MNSLTYSEVGGKREESFRRETRHIALVVVSVVWRFNASSTKSIASDSVTCITETSESVSIVILHNIFTQLTFLLFSLNNAKTTPYAIFDTLNFFNSE